MEANGEKLDTVAEHQELPKEAMGETIKRTGRHEDITEGAWMQQWYKGLGHNIAAMSEEGEDTWQHL